MPTTTTTLLNAVTASGRSGTTFTVDSSDGTIRAEGFAGADKLTVEVQDIAGTGWNTWRQDGKEVYLSAKQPEVYIHSRGVYTVNLESTPEGTISCVGLNETGV